MRTAVILFFLLLSSRAFALETAVCTKVESNNEAEIAYECVVEDAAATAKLNKLYESAVLSSSKKSEVPPAHGALGAKPAPAPKVKSVTSFVMKKVVVVLIKDIVKDAIKEAITEYLAKHGEKVLSVMLLEEELK